MEEGTISLIPTANTSVVGNEKIGDESIGRRGNGFREAELVIVPSCSPTRFPHLAPHLESAHHQPFGLHVGKSRQMRCEWSRYSTDDGTRHLRGRRRLGQWGMVKRDKDQEDWVTSSRTGAAISAHPIGHLDPWIV